MSTRFSGRSAWSWARALLGGALFGLVFLLSGDGARGAAYLPHQGQDPLEVLNSQIKPNVLILLDNSRSMKWAIESKLSVGADDPQSRMYNVKQALRSMLTTYHGRANFGLAHFNETSGNKQLNQNVAQNVAEGLYLQDVDGDAVSDGPLVYVSTDANAAAWAGVFNNGTDTATNGIDGYADTTGAGIFRSFMNRGSYGSGYPSGCTAGSTCRYYLQSRLWRSAKRYRCAAGLCTDSGESGIPSGCVEFETPAETSRARYCYTSAIFQSQLQPSTISDTFPVCGPKVPATVAACSTDNDATLQGLLAAEVAAPATDIPAVAAATGDLSLGSNPTPAGIRTDHANTIDSFYQVNSSYTTFFPTTVSGQKSFIVYVTDGFTDQDIVDAAPMAACFSTSPSSIVSDDASFARSIFVNRGTRTLVVSFSPSPNVPRANDVARAGSGGRILSGSHYECVSGDNKPCEDAFFAEDAEGLSHALDGVMSYVLSAGEFSAAPPILATIYELGGTPLDPKTRYNNRINIFYETTFENPGWHGHLRARQNDGTFLPAPSANLTGQFDAGQTLYEYVSRPMEQTAGSGGLDSFTFAELHGGATVRNIRTSSAVVKRRVLTSARNGKFTRSTANEWDAANDSGSNVVALWPPNQAGLNSGITDIDPPVGTAGPLDAALGIATQSFSDLQSNYLACDGPTGFTAPFASQSGTCDDVGNPTQALATARKEARQILLAWAGGARLRLNPNSATGKPERTASGDLLYRDRDWLLGDSQLGNMAVVSPPLRSAPNAKTVEWVLFRDGRRGTDSQGINEVDKGFGLRNPDFDDGSPEAKLDLKPVMTVVYVGANDGVHAFRAGPCTSSTSSINYVCSGGASESGGEELWSFVPYDQLAKIGLFVIQQGQGREADRYPYHLYMVATSLRVVDLFVPGSFTVADANGNDVTFTGRWRTMLVFGRGPGGKYYTALDVTAPGAFTRPALETNPPWVMWSRGNPDTQTGTACGVGTYNNNAADCTAFAKMGETWSTPAIGDVSATATDWRLWTGSGYSTNTAEGFTFFQMNALTGDVISSHPVGHGSGATFANALVAPPAAFNPYQLDRPNVSTRSVDAVSRIYIPDIHGRVWKFNTTSGGLFASEGLTQPFGSGLALLKLDPGTGERAFVYATSGNDLRVTPTSAAPFKIFGFRDPNAVTDASYPSSMTTPLVSSPTVLTTTSGDATTAYSFAREWKDSSGNLYRGTSRPTTSLNPSGNGRVFFVGTRARVVDACFTTFDSLLFGLGAATGGAAYDFGSDGVADVSKVLAGNRATGVQAVGGQVIVGQSGVGNTPPPSPPPPGAGFSSPPPPSPPAITTLSVLGTAPACR